MLVSHQFAFEGQELPPTKSHMYEYIVAAPGVFIRAHRSWLDVCYLLAPAHGLLHGLAHYSGYFQLDEAVPFKFTKAIFADAWRHKDIERLYYGVYRPGGWKFLIPQQHATFGRVTPLDPFNKSGQEALIELHSHGEMPAFFSSADNADETGFKIYTVIGRVGSARPEILTRVGVYGHFWTIRSNWVYQIPTPVRDAGFEPAYPDQSDYPEESTYTNKLMEDITWI